MKCNHCNTEVDLAKQRYGTHLQNCGTYKAKKGMAAGSAADSVPTHSRIASITPRDPFDASEKTLSKKMGAMSVASSKNPVARLDPQDNFTKAAVSSLQKASGLIAPNGASLQKL